MRVLSPAAGSKAKVRMEIEMEESASSPTRQ
jgi:hypothetical protein